MSCAVPETLALGAGGNSGMMRPRLATFFVHVAADTFSCSRFKY